MGVLEGCDRFLKYMFFFFTFVFWLLGICAIAIGIWAVADKDFEKILDLHVPGLDAHAVKQAAILLIVVGVGVMIVGFFGCCGAMKENQCLLVLFFGCLFLTFVLMIAGAVMATGYQSTLENILKVGLKKLKDDYKTEPKSKEALDNIQQEFKCCEFNATEEIPPSCSAPGASTAVPPATPPTAPATAPATASTAGPTATAANATVSGNSRKRAAGSERYKGGCAEEIMKKVNAVLDEYKVRIVGIGVASAVIVVIGMIVSMALCCKIRRGYQNV